MRLHFIGNVLCTKLKVRGNNRLDYCNVLVDTGAFKTCLPLQDCNHLEYVGLHPAVGVFGSEVSPLFKCQIELEDDDFHDLEILGLPIPEPIVGRDILSKYKIEINWVSRTANAYRLI